MRSLVFGGAAVGTILAVRGSEWSCGVGLIALVVLDDGAADYLRRSVSYLPTTPCLMLASASCSHRYKRSFQDECGSLGLRASDAEFGDAVAGRGVSVSATIYCYNSAAEYASRATTTPASLDIKRRSRCVT